MGNQTQFRFGKLLLTFVLLLALGRQCCAYYSTGPRCSLGGSPTIPAKCPNDFFPDNLPDCPTRYFCYLQKGEQCNSNQRESVCAGDMICKCGICQNCYGKNCNLTICPNEIEKRLPAWYPSGWQRSSPPYRLNNWQGMAEK